MRLSFLHGEHADVILQEGQLRLGAAAGNGVVIDSLGACQACFEVARPRGITLQVTGPPVFTHVNGRPVHHKAILRLGDIVSLGTLSILLQPDHEEEIQTSIPPITPVAGDPMARLAATRVVLRGNSDVQFGRSFPVVAPLLIGRGKEAAVRIDDPAVGERHAQLENHGEFIVLRDLGSTEGSLVNGVPVRDAILHPGDQLVIEQMRFILEAPGLPLRGHALVARREPITPIASKPPPIADQSKAELGSPIWWLIAAAAFIMVSLAALLFFSG